MQKEEEEIFLKNVGRRIKEIRVSKFLSLVDLSVIMDNHPEQLSRVERGVHNVTITTLKNIANALGVDIGDFFK